MPLLTIRQSSPRLFHFSELKIMESSTRRLHEYLSSVQRVEKPVVVDWPLLRATWGCGTIKYQPLYRATCPQWFIWSDRQLAGWSGAPTVVTIGDWVPQVPSTRVIQYTALFSVRVMGKWWTHVEASRSHILTITRNKHILTYWNSTFEQQEHMGKHFSTACVEMC